jgi:hypothetical protein
VEEPAKRFIELVGGALVVGPRTLWRRLREKGLLRRWDGDHITARARIQGRLRRPLDLDSARVFPLCAEDRSDRSHRSQHGSGGTDGEAVVTDVTDVTDPGD